ENAAGKQRWREWQRVMGIAIGILGNEEVVTDQKCRDHRAGWNVKRLEQKCADDHCDNDRVDHHAYGFADALTAFGSGLHAHSPIVPLHPSKIAARAPRILVTFGAHARNSEKD